MVVNACKGGVAVGLAYSTRCKCCGRPADARRTHSHVHAQGRSGVGNRPCAWWSEGHGTIPSNGTAVMMHRSVVRMCGIMGVFRQEGNVAPEIYEGLLMLQHRGQDSAGAWLACQPCPSIALRVGAST